MNFIVGRSPKAQQSMKAWHLTDLIVHQDCELLGVQHYRPRLDFLLDLRHSSLTQTAPGAATSTRVSSQLYGWLNLKQLCSFRLVRRSDLSALCAYEDPKVLAMQHTG